MIMSEPRHINDLLRDMVTDLFDRIENSKEDGRAERIAARDRHMPEICRILDMEYEPMRKSA